MEEYSLIANTGIQMFTLSLEIDKEDKFKSWFHEWYDKDEGKYKLEPVLELRFDDDEMDPSYYSKPELYKMSLLGDIDKLDKKKLEAYGINPLPELCEDEEDGDNCGLFNISSTSEKNNTISNFEDKWLPLPYFFKKSETIFDVGPLNWARFKFKKRKNTEGSIIYDVVFAFDTRAVFEKNEYYECPVFPDGASSEMSFELCSNEILLMDYCTPNEERNNKYIDEYLLSLVHPDAHSADSIKVSNGPRMSYVASYMAFINYVNHKQAFPRIKLCKDKDVVIKNVDMVVDIGNSKTTSLLVEENNFNQVRLLRLVDHSDTLNFDKQGKSVVRSYSDPFDMRLAFRKVSFGDFGVVNSRQFVYPSLVRLGKEANDLIHKSIHSNGLETLSTCSSPKRYLWDWRANKEDWNFLVLPGEKGGNIMELSGITAYLNSDGSVNREGEGGTSFHYSRKSLMTFSFLEMLVQAYAQINSVDYREEMGIVTSPRLLRRIIVTCPTAMSKQERGALVDCARDAVFLFENFVFDGDDTHKTIEIVPSKSTFNGGPQWYYDEATCSQLVYVYGEAGYKYKGRCNEFFDLYGKKEMGQSQSSLTIGTLDIGAGTTDLMISKYSYSATSICPDPLFYDSFYFAGDDMMKALIKNLMLLNPSDSAFYQNLDGVSCENNTQKIKDFFGEDYNGQTYADRILRKDFNLQYSVPLMNYFLNLLCNDSEDCEVTYQDVFSDCPPCQIVIDGFKDHFGLDITTLEWTYRKEDVNKIVTNEFEPLLKKIATMMYSYAADIVLLSGRPASLPIIRKLFLKYYPVSPNRLIVLNNYYVGNWYPFCNNTGYISNPKTIVAVGGLIGHYATDLLSLNKFSIDLSKIKGKLKSTANFVEGTREGEKLTDYVFEPNKNSGDLSVTSIPAYLKVRQINMDSYPSRSLYTIDFNRSKIAEKIKSKSQTPLPDASVLNEVKDYTEKLQKRMPFKISLERDGSDIEKLSITSIIDRNGDEIFESNLEIHIQSLGINERYWLDSGAFDF